MSHEHRAELSFDSCRTTVIRNEVTEVTDDLFIRSTTDRELQYDSGAVSYGSVDGPE